MGQLGLYLGVVEQCLLEINADIASRTMGSSATIWIREENIG